MTACTVQVLVGGFEGPYSGIEQLCRMALAAVIQSGAVVLQNCQIT